MMFGAMAGRVPLLCLELCGDKRTDHAHFNPQQWFCVRNRRSVAQNEEEEEKEKKYD